MASSSASRVLLLLLALPLKAAAAEPRLFVELDYDTGMLEGCPSDTAFRAMTSAQLGYDPFREVSSERVVARARPSEPGIRGSIEWYDNAGTRQGARELSSEKGDCADLARAMSFAIAVQIQLLAREAEAAQAPAVSTRPEPETGARPSPSPTSARDERAGAPSPTLPDATLTVRFAAGAGPSVGLGLAPRVVLSGRVFAMVWYEDFVVELGAEASLPSTHETAGGTGFEQQVAFGSAAGCLIARQLSACLVSKVGRVAIRGFGVDEPRSPAGALAQIGPRFSLGQELAGPLVGALRVEFLMNLVSWRVTLDDQQLWRTPLVSLSAGADLAVLFQ